MREFEKINDHLRELFAGFINEELAGKKRFDLNQLQEFIINKLKGAGAYSELGGYQALYRLIKYKARVGEIRAIKSSPFNGRDPALKTRWELIKKEGEKWDEREVLRLSSLLDLGYYLKRPQLQTARLLLRLKNVYNFLKEKGSREWASREERALELFADEKFFAKKEGRKFLSRLKLSLGDLKAEKYSQMFVYWQKEVEINKVLILENHSTFISCKRALAEGIPVFSRDFDTLIYGSGKQIVKSLAFLKEIADIEQVKAYYAGDIDPAGFLIYHSLKKRYPDYDLQLYKKFYREMVKRGNDDNYTVETDQNKNRTVLETVLAEFEHRQFRDKITYLWENNMRIPQEVITYEVLKNSYQL